MGLTGVLIVVISALFFYDSTPTDRLVVLDNGNVGIGTTDPGAYKLNVKGS